MRSADIVGALASGAVDARILARSRNEDGNLRALHVRLQLFVGVVSGPDQRLT